MPRLRSGLRHIVPAHRRVHLGLIGALLLLAAQGAAAQVREWTLVEPGLQRRATVALQRYYTIVHPDSIRLRYLRTNATVMPYHLRGIRSGEDSTGQLLSVSLGQLSLYSVSNLRVAFGDDLYEALLVSRTDSAADEHLIYAGEGLWEDPIDEHRVGIALDRIDYRINRTLGLFAQVGSPESNYLWWTDGTARIGVTSTAWEFAALLPLGVGATGVGPYRARLLAPGFGAALRVRLANIVARIRVAGAGDPSFDAPHTTDDLFVHTLASQAAYQQSLATGFGPFLLSGGVDYEEFASVVRDANGDAAQTRRIRRLSPLFDLAWSDLEGNVRASIGVANLALRGSLRLRLTDALALELQAVDNDLFRRIKPFEHPFLIFFTPQIRL